MQADCLPAAEYPDGFNEFWSVFPRKVGKKAAHESWVKNGLEYRWREIVEHVKTRRETDAWQDQKYVPHPSTFLNQQRWTDEIEAPKKEIKRPVTIDNPPECPRCNAVMRWDGTCAFGCGIR